MSSSRYGVCTRLPTAAIDIFPDNNCFASCNNKNITTYVHCTLTVNTTH